MLRFNLRNKKLGNKNNIGDIDKQYGSKVNNYKLSKPNNINNNDRFSVKKQVYQIGTGSNANNKISSYIYHSQNPLAVYRKTLNCNDNGNCFNTNIVYKDNYSKNSCKDMKCKNTRSLQPLIKSGMQLNNNQYSTSFYEHNRNYKKNIYSKNLPTNKNNVSYYNSSNKVNCDDGVCNNRQIHNKYSNPKHSTNSAVSSSTRLERLKLETMLSSNRCNNNNNICNGKLINNINNNKIHVNQPNNCNTCKFPSMMRIKSYGGVNNNSNPINKWY
tara:strand:+ start:279 stop:1094 length:816 start_codon:yes stop_codon:yes gene_type:complete